MSGLPSVRGAVKAAGNSFAWNASDSEKISTMAQTFCTRVLQYVSRQGYAQDDVAVVGTFGTLARRDAEYTIHSDRIRTQEYASNAFLQLFQEGPKLEVNVNNTSQDVAWKPILQSFLQALVNAFTQSAQRVQLGISRDARNALVSELASSLSIPVEYMDPSGSVHAVWNDKGVIRVRWWLTGDLLEFRCMCMRASNRRTVNRQWLRELVESKGGKIELKMYDDSVYAVLPASEKERIDHERERRKQDELKSHATEAKQERERMRKEEEAKRREELRKQEQAKREELERARKQIQEEEEIRLKREKEESRRQAFAQARAQMDEEKMQKKKALPEARVKRGMWNRPQVEDEPFRPEPKPPSPFPMRPQPPPPPQDARPGTHHSRQHHGHHRHHHASHHPHRSVSGEVDPKSDSGPHQFRFPRPPPGSRPGPGRPNPLDRMGPQHFLTQRISACLACGGLILR